MSNQGAIRVLLVDDEADVTRWLKIGLERRGFVVDAFNDPTVAILEAKGGYAVAIFDIRMPGMSGFELCRRFKRVDSNAGVFFMTAFDISPREFKVLFPDAGVEGLLTKPVTVDRIVQEIERFINRQSAKQGVQDSRDNT